MMELLAIVNDKDEIIGCKERGTLLSRDIYRVFALWIENSKGQVLLAKRALTKKKDPGMWGPAVAGTVNKKETYESNIIKESKEELGLKKIKLKKWKKQRTTEPYNHFIQWFFLKIDKPLNYFKIQKEEVEEIKWFNKDEIIKLVEKDDIILIESLKYFVRKFINKNV